MEDIRAGPSTNSYTTKFSVAVTGPKADQRRTQLNQRQAWQPETAPIVAGRKALPLVKTGGLRRLQCFGAGIALTALARLKPCAIETVLECIGRVLRTAMRPESASATYLRSLTDRLPFKEEDCVTKTISADAAPPDHELGTLSLGIACPMANEGREAVRFVREALEQCDGFRSVQFFAVLDRATKDDTLDLLRAYAEHEPRLVVVWAPENRCVVDAYLRGYREALAAGCDWILEIDAGFSHRPEDIRPFFAPMQRGYECVFGSRFMRGGSIRRSSWKRYAISRGGTLLTNLLLGTRLTDMTSGFEMFSRDALESILQQGIRSRAHFFQTEIKVHCRNRRIIEVPIRYEAASPRLGTSALKDAFAHLWRLYRLSHLQPATGLRMTSNGGLSSRLRYQSQSAERNSVNRSGLASVEVPKTS